MRVKDNKIVFFLLDCTYSKLCYATMALDDTLKKPLNCCGLVQSWIFIPRFPFHSLPFLAQKMGWAFQLHECREHRQPNHSGKCWRSNVRTIDSQILHVCSRSHEFLKNEGQRCRGIVSRNGMSKLDCIRSYVPSSSFINSLDVKSLWSASREILLSRR